MSLFKNIKRRSSSTLFSNNLKNYFTNSSVHGLRYLTETHRPAHEKRFWFLMICASFTICTIMIWQVYDKWDRSPVIVGISEKPSPISEIPFPAVTICPVNKVRQSVFNYSQAYYTSINMLPNDYNYSRSEQIIYANIVPICTEKPKDSSLAEFLLPFDEFVQIMDNVSSRFMHQSSCAYSRELLSCYELFDEVVTEEGLCYTFNGLSNDDVFRRENIDPLFLIGRHNTTASWTIEDGFHKNDTHPRKSYSKVDTFGLRVHTESLDVDQDYICQGAFEGFRIMIHSPSDYPRVLRQTNLAQIGFTTYIGVKPVITQTSDELRAYSPERRQCYFNNERYLRFFKVYSQYNCELECMANATRTACGCVHFAMPRSPNTPICNVFTSQWSCITYALLNVAHQRKADSREFKCNCLPSCTSLTYEVKQTQNKIIYKKFNQEIKVKNLTMYNTLMPSNLFVFFREVQFIASKRKALYGTIDFVSYCGSLLGLCMGVSLLSFIELIYFWSIRLRNTEGRNLN